VTRIVWQSRNLGGVASLHLGRTKQFTPLSNTDAPKPSKSLGESTYPSGRGVSDSDVDIQVNPPLPLGTLVGRPQLL